MAALLVVVHIAFVTIGLSSALLGSAWPVMHANLGVSLASGGVLAFIVACSALLASVCSERLFGSLGAGPLSVIGLFMMAAALLGLSMAPSFAWACAWSMPLGLGTGVMMAALRNLIVLHCQVKHILWLHCAWGTGAALGPLVISHAITGGLWRDGYYAVGTALLVLVVILAVTFPLWGRLQHLEGSIPAGENQPQGLLPVACMPDIKAVQMALLSYCGLDAAVGLWGSSYLVYAHDIPAGFAAGWVSLYYIGITVGQTTFSPLARKLQARLLLFAGMACLAGGIALLMLPLGHAALMCGFLCIGLGCAPIHHTLLHMMPRSLGRNSPQAPMGIQMASAYVGSTLYPALFGLLGTAIGYQVFPLYIGLLLLLLAAMLWRLQATAKERMVYAR